MKGFLMSKMQWVVILMVVLSLGALAVQVPAAAQAGPATPANVVRIEVTINDDTNELSIGGYTPAQLRTVGINPLSKDLTAILTQLKQVHAVVDGQQILVDVDGEQLAAVAWNDANRKALMDVASRYGLYLGQPVQERVNTWLSDIQLELTVRVSKETSKPFELSLARMIQADIADNGNVSVEGVPVGTAVRQDVLDLIRQGQIQNATVCWNRGTIQTTVNGDALPSVTLYEKGAQVLNQLLGQQQVANVGNLFTSIVGVDTSVDGAAHSPLFCGISR